MFVRQRVKRPFIGGGRRRLTLSTDVHVISASGIARWIARRILSGPSLIDRRTTRS